MTRGSIGKFIKNVKVLKTFIIIFTADFGGRMEINMKKILKTSIPPVCTYPGATNLFSILWNNPEKVMPWICDHYIQIALSTGNMLLNFMK